MKSKMIKNVDWTKSPNIIAGKIHALKPKYAVKLAYKFNVDEGDLNGDWYLALHQAIVCILANPNYKQTVSSACIFGYRKLADMYRNKFTVISKFQPEQLLHRAYISTGRKSINSTLMYHEFLYGFGYEVQNQCGCKVVNSNSNED